MTKLSPTQLAFTQVDAFTDRPFAGNPAAVMPLDAWLPDDVLQAIAAENNLSETAFLVPSAEPGVDRDQRWFTPANEVAMCGHATLASGHVLLSADAALDRVVFATRQAGRLEVAREGDGYALSLPAWVPAPQPLPEIVAALGVEPEVETWWHPQRYAVVMLANEAAVRAVEPDFRRLAAMGDVLAIVTAPGDDADVASRAFVPGGGIDEDPVTGSAHAVLAPVWAGRLGRDRFTAHQVSRRGGRLEVCLAGDRVVLSGRCFAVIEGQFRLG